MAEDPELLDELSESQLGPLDVSIVMPCLNEERTLGACIDAAKRTLDMLQREYGFDGEVVVADNGSTDSSVQIARDRKVRTVPVDRRGYGNALRGGIEEARGHYVVIGDSDCSYDFEESIAMIERLVAGFDICMGTRLRGTILRGAMPWKNRYIGNPILTGVLNLFFHTKISDAHCGLRAFTKDAFERLRLNSEGMEFASEMIIKAALLNMKITEVPVTLNPDRRDRSPHLRPWHDGWRHLRYLLMLSPGWLFFVPSAVFFIVGMSIFCVLLFSQGETMVRLGPFWFGDHWMILSGAMVAISHQSALFGVAAMLYGFFAGYRDIGRTGLRLLGLTRLEYMLIGGGVLLIAAAVILMLVVISWSSEGFGALAATRQMVAVSTFAMLGFQNIFGGFLLSIIRGNRARGD